MRAFPVLLANSYVELIVAGIFLLALFIRWVFLHFRPSWIGFWTGILWLAAAEAVVQVVITPPPGACDSGGVSCEWLGIGRLFLLILGVGLVALYLILALILGRTYRRLAQRGDGARRVRPGVVFSLAAVLGCGTLVGLGLGVAATNVAESGLGVPWLTMPNIPLAAGENITRLPAAGAFFVILETDQNRTLRGKFDVNSGTIQASWDSLTPGSMGSGKTVVDYQPCAVDFWVPAPPKAPLAYASARQCDRAFAAQSDFALANGATLYVWSRQVALDSFPSYNIAALAGPALGFTLAMVVALLIERKKAVPY
jgi:hypothetical protein